MPTNMMIVTEGKHKGKLVTVLLIKYGYAVISLGGGHGEPLDLIPAAWLDACD